jgi:hypothetical protein
MINAISAISFIDTLGVNTHIGIGGSYSNLSEIAQNINYLGIHTVRDSIADASVIPQWQQVAQAAGIKFDDYMPEGAPSWDQGALSLVPQLVADGLLSFVEGGNEEDDSYAAANGNTLAWTAQFQQQVWAMGQQYHLPVINMSFGSGWTAANNWQGDYPNVGDLSAYTNYANAHTYPNVGQTPDSTIQSLNSDAKLAASQRPVITTEYGWETSQYGLTQIAQFVVDASFDGIKDGDAGMWYYGLYDDSSGNWGLFNSDGSARPAATALHNLTTLLADSGANFTPGSLNYSISGTQAGDHSFLIEKSNGQFWIGLWNESGGTHTVTVNLPAAASAIDVYDPITGASAIKAVSNAASVSVSMGSDPLLLQVVPGGSTTTPPPASPAVSAPASKTVTTGGTISVTGVSFADPNANAGTIALTVSDTAGALKMTSSGMALAGSGTHSITVTGSASQLNADLASLQYTAASTVGSDSIAINVKDQTGANGSGKIGVTVNAPSTSTSPFITAPAGKTVASGASVAVTPLSVTDSFAATNLGSMVLNVWDQTGTLAIAGQTFNPGATATLSGSLSQINADLATLSYKAGAAPGTDTITVDVWDQAGTEILKNVPVTITSSSGSSSTDGSSNTSTVTIASTDAAPVITQSKVNVVATSGDHTIYMEGTGDTILATGGTETVMAFLGGNTITTGAGGDTIRIAGTGNVVTAGAGANEIDDSGSGNRIVLPAAGQGSDSIYGYILQNSDILDLRPLLKGTAWTGTASSIGNCVHVSTPDGADSIISVTPTGVAGGATYNVATLEGSGPVSLSTLLAHSIT